MLVGKICILPRHATLTLPRATYSISWTEPPEKENSFVAKIFLLAMCSGFVEGGNANCAKVSLSPLARNSALYRRNPARLSALRTTTITTPIATAAAKQIATFRILFTSRD
jgi:hypothetical protein